MSDTLRAIGLMTLSMACFALADAAFKGATSAVGPGMMLFLLGVLGAAGYHLLLAMKGMPHYSRAFLNPAVQVRTWSEMIASIAFLVSLVVVDLSVQSTILQSVPLMVTLGAALFLREHIGPRRWAALLIGFVGVLIILQPTNARFEPMLILTLVAAIGLAGRDLASRMVPKDLPTLMVSAWGFDALILGGVITMLILGEALVLPETWGLALIVVGSALAGVAVFAITSAMRIGDVGSVSSFRYTRLIFGMLAAMVFFGERPGLNVWIGAAIIVGSGLFILWRERRMG